MFFSSYLNKLIALFLCSFHSFFGVRFILLSSVWICLFLFCAIRLLLRAQEYPSYTKMREEREEFRKTLVSLIMSKENGDKADENDTFPNSQERQLLRYYYYIKHGINTSHIAPMTKRMLNK